ncbi:unnamed protein product, partial [marine sediment metagenome]
DEWTICLWTQRDTFSTTYRIMGMDDADTVIYTNEHSFRMVWTPSGVQYSSDIFDRGTTGMTAVNSSTDWKLHCFVRNSTGYAYYLDNTLESQNTTFVATWVDQNKVLTLNSNTKPASVCTNEGMDGIDEVGLWNRALNETHLDLVWNEGAGVSYEATAETNNTWNSTFEENLRAIWNFEETSGTVLFDVWNYTSNGTNNGATLQATGINNYAYDFESTEFDNVTIPTTAQLESDSVTINV